MLPSSLKILSDSFARRLGGAWWLIAALLLLPWMISTDSLWIDEGQTAIYASLPSLDQFAEKIAHDNRSGGLSEGLMPLSMFLTWAAAKVFGMSEIGLRIPNLFYLAIACLCLWKTGSRLKISGLVMVFALHPFVWQYADEARPYALQLALGCGLLWSMTAVLDDPNHHLPWLGYFATCFLLFASSLLCCIPVTVSGLIILYHLVSIRWKPNRLVVGCAIIAAIPFFLLSVFYLKAMQGMASGAKLWVFGPSNVAYALYELLGFQGLGPSRTELRDTARAQASLWKLFAPHVWLLGALFVAISAITIRGFIKWNRQLIPPTAMILLTFLGFCSLGIANGFPFWGRHLAPVLPFCLLLMLMLCGSFSAGFPRHLAISALAALWVISAVQFRLSPRFANDDYRGAATFAKQALAQNHTIWWVADTSAANYYGLNLTESGPGQYIRNASKEHLVSLPPPSYVVISKPDIYDNAGGATGFVADKGYTLVRKPVAFEIWKSPGTPSQNHSK